MNRRKFLTLASGTTLASIGPFFHIRKSWAQSSVPDVYNQANGSHAVLFGNSLYGGGPTANDWSSVSNTLAGVLSEWKQSGRDDQVRSVAGYVDPSQVTSSNFDQSSILSLMQSYTPSVQLSDVQYALSYIDSHQNSIPWVLEVLQEQGMAFFLNNGITNASYLASNPPTATANIASQSLVTPMLRPPLQPPDGGGGGGRGYNCKADNVSMMYVGIALATIGFMSFGTAPLLYGAAWGYITVFGGAGLSAWGVGHNMVCGV